MKSFGPKNFKFHAWVKKCHLGNFSEIGWLAELAKPCYCSSPKKLTGFFFSLLYLYIFIFFEYETIFRSSAWSFGHSDPDPSSVSSKVEFFCSFFGRIKETINCFRDLLTFSMVSSQTGSMPIFVQKMLRTNKMLTQMWLLKW